MPSILVVLSAYNEASHMHGLCGDGVNGVDSVDAVSGGVRGVGGAYGPTHVSHVSHVSRDVSRVSRYVSRHVSRVSQGFRTFRSWSAWFTLGYAARVRAIRTRFAKYARVSHRLRAAYSRHKMAARRVDLAVPYLACRVNDPR